MQLLSWNDPYLLISFYMLNTTIESLIVEQQENQIETSGEQYSKTFSKPASFFRKYQILFEAFSTKKKQLEYARKYV